MKFVAILFALSMAHQMCQSLPLSDSSEDDDSISDIMNDSSEFDDSSESDDLKAPYEGRKFVKEFVLDPSVMKKDVFRFGERKGMNSIDKKTAIESFSNNDADLSVDDEVDSDETEFAYVKSSSSEVDLNDKSVLTQSFRRPRPVGEGTPYIRKDQRNKPRQYLPFNRKVVPKEGTPDDFEKQIEELKKEIQRMKVLDQSESSEDVDAESESNEFVGELVKKIKSLRDEIRVEKGIKIEESDESESMDDFYDESSSEEELSKELSEELSEDKTDLNMEHIEISSEEQDGIKQIKLTQTFDGQDEPESDNAKTEEEAEDDQFNQLVKIIEKLKEEIKEERKLENANDADYDDYEEPVDEKLLSIFEELEVNDDLKDIKHFNIENNEGEEKPLLDIEKPENLNSDEVKIGFVISNEDANSDESKIIDLLNGSVESPPIEFPKNVVEFIEIVEIPVIAVKQQNAVKKFYDAKKAVPENSITGGILSKVSSIFNYVKNQFL